MLARLARCRRGATAMEAAFVFPVLLALVLGVIEFGLLLFTYSSMQTAARDVTRQIAVNFVSIVGADGAVADRLPSWAAGGLDVAVTQSAPGDPENNIIRMRLSLPADRATPLRFFTKMRDGWVLASEVEMKQELPFAAATP